MSITARKLSRAAGLSAALAGLLFIGIQFIHPTEEVASVTTPLWAATGYLTFAMAVLGLIGVLGIYLRQVEETGIVGLLGFVQLGLFFLLTTAFTFAEATILPAVVGEAPHFVESFLGLFNGAGSGGSLGALDAAPAVAGTLYMFGGVLFGVGLFRARLLAPWAAILWVAGAVLPLLMSTAPHSVVRLAAIPVGLALAGLGYSLWSADAPAPSKRRVKTQRA